MVSCTAFKCFNRSGPMKANVTNRKISWHKYSEKVKEPKRYAQWVRAVRRARWKPTLTSHLCSDHFEERHFIKTKNRTRLCPSAISSIFNFPESLTRRAPCRPRKPLKDRSNVSMDASTGVSLEATRKSDTEHVGAREKGIETTNTYDPKIDGKNAYQPVQISAFDGKNAYQPVQISAFDNKLGLIRHQGEGNKPESSSLGDNGMLRAHVLSYETGDNENESSHSKGDEEDDTHVEQTDYPLQSEDFDVLTTSESHDHTYNIGEESSWLVDRLKGAMSRVQELEAKLKVLECKIEKKDGRLKDLNKKLKAATQSNKYYKKKLHELQTCLKEARNSKQGGLSHDMVEDLEDLCGSFTPVLLRYLTNVRKDNVSRKNYPPELRQFALTLPAYSAKSYEYVRDKLAKGLPSPRTIRKGMQVVDCEPGIIRHTLVMLRRKVADAEAKGEEVLANIMFDEIAIKKGMEFNGKHFFGKVDLGLDLPFQITKPDSDAREALVFMLVGVNGHWKLPLSYYLIDGLNSPERAELFKINAKEVENVGVELISLICDGLSANLSMATLLGCSLTPPDLQTTIVHPGNSEKRIHFVLDVCHCLKLVRNTLGSRNIITPEGSIISFKFVEELDNIQTNEGLKAANKLSKRRVNWQKIKMKVKVAAQTLSRSVAHAMSFCREDLKLEQFKGSKATSDFVLLFDQLFDVFNSKNILTQGFKAAMSRENEESWRELFSRAKSYIYLLRNDAGQRLCESKAKTGFIGYLIAMKSFEDLFDHLVGSDRLKQLVTFRWSQDHLETFFSGVRATLGFNNNPTVCQFFSSMKKLIVQTDIRGGPGQNCDNQDIPDVLMVSSAIPRKKHPRFNQTESISNDIEITIDY